MNGTDTTTRGSFSDWWPALGVSSDLTPVTLAINAGLSVIVVALAIVGSYLISKLIRNAFMRLLHRITPDAPDQCPPRSALALVQAAIWITAIVTVLYVWGFEISALLAAPLFAAALKIIAILVIAILAWELAIIAIDAAFRKAAATATNARRAAQLRSLAPMLRGALRSVIAIFAGMLILSQLGVEIAPLLAGAGVVGIAIGFGAQTLVKDYLTGFSLILEDIVSVGDIVRVGDDGGLVETMTLRTLRLRDFDGTLHVIPYSEAQTVHNLTKTFSYYVFELPISYDSSIDDALRLMQETGAEMQRDPRFEAHILEPIEVVGVDQLGDSGVVLKARIKTAPVQQWNVGREYNRRIKLAFDRAGIEIPVPHLKVLLSDRALAAVKPN